MKTIDKWYDKFTKSWVVQLKDENDYQIGDAIYVYSKREADNITIEDFQGVNYGFVNDEQ